MRKPRCRRPPSLKKADSATAVGLPISWYFDPEILEIERRELFAAGPNYAGHQCLVPRDGDFAVRGGPQTGRVLVRNQRRAATTLQRLPPPPVAACSPAAATPSTSSARSTTGPTTSTAARSPRPSWARIRGSIWSARELTDWNGLLFTGPRDVRRELAPLDDWTRTCRPRRRAGTRRRGRARPQLEGVPRDLPGRLPHRHGPSGLPRVRRSRATCTGALQLTRRRAVLLRAGERPLAASRPPVRRCSANIKRC